MLYTRFGNTGLVVSRLAFGAMTFGNGNLPTIYKVDDKGADPLVGRALEAGSTQTTLTQSGNAGDDDGTPVPVQTHD